MGAVISRFKKKVTTKEKLEKIQEDINILEEYREHTEQRRKKLVGSLIAYSIVFYLLAAVICYFYYLPPTLEERLLYATPFAGFIILIYFIKTILTSYYRWKVRRNENKLLLLRERREEILDQVMETETYKVAKDILETFAPEQIRKATMTLKSPVSSPAGNSHRMPLVQSGEVRRRIISTPAQTFAPRATPSSVRPNVAPVSFPYARPHMTPHMQQSVVRPNVSTPSHSSLQGPKTMFSPVTPMNSHTLRRPDGGGGLHAPNSQGGDHPPGPPMPRPILPRERGMLDRFVEYLVGDGPSNRYALVCRQCESHNGMALKEEFPYIAFRCAYCFYWNPARKQKPAPPRLENSPPRMTVEMSRRMLEKEEAEESSSSEEDDDDDEEDTESDSTADSNPSSDDADDPKGMSVTNRSSLLVAVNRVPKEETELPKEESVPEAKSLSSHPSSTSKSEASEELTSSSDDAKKVSPSTTEENAEEIAHEQPS